MSRETLRFLKWPALCTALGLLAVFGLSRLGAPPAKLRQDAYIWQRQWTPALTEAIKRSSDIVGSWRVLAAESDSDGGLLPVAIDWQVLRNSGLPVIPVVRINGNLDDDKEVSILAGLDLLRFDWISNGANFNRLEIDYDCATSQLVNYARFLDRVRAKIIPGGGLSATALPTWLSSRDSDAILAATDQIVLQVHAVQNPRDGIFSQELALRWIRALARRDSKQFYVALPAYGVRVSWRKDGTLFAAEGEAPTLAGHENGLELMASPAELLALTQALKREHPANLQGIVWFRLPTADDRRTWSPTTWRQVITGQTLKSDVQVETQSVPERNFREVLVVNGSNADASPPESVSFAGNCDADGANGYVLDREVSGTTLRMVEGGLLKPGQTREIGWIRCRQGGEHADVQK